MVSLPKRKLLKRFLHPKIGHPLIGMILTGKGTRYSLSNLVIEHLKKNHFFFAVKQNLMKFANQTFLSLTPVFKT